MNIKVQYKGKRPTKGTPGSAGYDIYSAEDFTIYPDWNYKVFTGLHVSIPEGYFGLVKARSGLSFNYNIEVGAGVIDSDYTGEIKVKLYNFGVDPVGFKEGDRVAQILFLPVASVDWEEVDEFDDTARGDGGFGSTGR